MLSVLAAGVVFYSISPVCVGLHHRCFSLALWNQSLSQREIRCVCVRVCAWSEIEGSTLGQESAPSAAHLFSSQTGLNAPVFRILPANVPSRVCTCVGMPYDHVCLFMCRDMCECVYSRCVTSCVWPFPDGSNPYTLKLCFSTSSHLWETQDQGTSRTDQSPAGDGERERMGLGGTEYWANKTLRLTVSRWSGEDYWNTQVWNTGKLLYLLFSSIFCSVSF